MLILTDRDTERETVGGMSYWVIENKRKSYQVVLSTGVLVSEGVQRKFDCREASDGIGHDSVDM